jgi:hypothetical protein
MVTINVMHAPVDCRGRKEWWAVAGKPILQHHVAWLLANGVSPALFA